MHDGNGPRTVAVIGAGIVGVATAIWLLRDGQRVILIDREGPAAGASHGNGGVLASAAVVPVTTPGILGKAPKMLMDPDQPLFLRWRYLPRLLPWLLPYLRNATEPAVRARAIAMNRLIGDSLADHQALSAGTGAERYVVPSDYLYLYRDRAAFEADGFGWQVRRDCGVTWDVLERDAMAAFDPCFGPEIGCGIRMGNHGRISDPGAYVKALAAHAETLGARFLRGTVQDLVRDGGRVTGVRVDGQTVPCDAALVSIGAWSGPLGKALGLRVPLETERGYHLELWDPSVMPRTPVMVAAGKFVATPMDGRLRLAGVVEFGGLDAPPSDAPFRLLERQVRAAMPGLTWKRTVEWMGHRPSITDSLPLLGAVPGLDGAFVGFGHDHVGMTGGPKTGRILSQLISGRRPNIDLAPFAPDRFQ